MSMNLVKARAGHRNALLLEKCPALMPMPEPTPMRGVVPPPEAPEKPPTEPRLPRLPTPEPEPEPEDTGPEPGRVFISYNWDSATSEWASSLKQALEDRGVMTTWDPKAEFYPDALEFHVQKAEYFLALVTPSYVADLKDRQARRHREARWAVKYGAKVVMVLHRRHVGDPPFTPALLELADSAGPLFSPQERDALFGVRSLQHYVDKDYHKVFQSHVLSRLGHKQPDASKQQVLEALELAGLASCYDLLTLSRAYGGGGVSTLGDLRGLLADPSGTWTYKLGLSLPAHGRLMACIGQWRQLSCMPAWMRHADLRLGLALAQALDSGALEASAVLDLAALGEMGAVGEEGAVSLAKFIVEYASVLSAPPPTTPRRKRLPSSTSALGLAPQLSRTPRSVRTSDSGGDSTRSAFAAASAHGIRHPPTLSVLGLSSCALGTRGAAEVFDSLRACRVPLVQMDLRDNGLGAQAVASLVGALRAMPLLRQLDVSGNPIDDSSGVVLLQCLSRYNHSLSRLGLARTHIGGETARALGSLLVAAGPSRSSNRSNGGGSNGAAKAGSAGGGRRSTCELSHVTVAHTSMAPRELLGFAPGFAHLEDLDVEGSVTDSSCLQAFMCSCLEASGSTSQRRRGGGGHNESGSEQDGGSSGYDDDEQHGSSGGGGGPNGWSGTDHKRHQPAVGPRRLVLSNCQLGQTEASDLAALLKHTKRLQELHLAHNTFGQYGVLLLSRSISANANGSLAGLTLLDLSHCHLGSETPGTAGAAGTLAEAVAQLPSLTALRLEGCGLGPEEMAAVCDAAAMQPELAGLLEEVVVGALVPPRSPRGAPPEPAPSSVTDGYSPRDELVMGLQDALLQLRKLLHQQDAFGPDTLADLPHQMAQEQELLQGSVHTGPGAVLSMLFSHTRLRPVLRMALAKSGPGASRRDVVKQVKKLVGMLYTTGAPLSELMLGHNELTAAATAAAARAVVLSGCVTKLGLQNCALQPDSFECFSHANLVARTLQEALGRSPELNWLDLSECGLSAELAQGLVRLIDCCPQLQHLRLDNNRLPPDPMRTLGNAITKQGALRSLSLNGCCDDVGSMGTAVNVLASNTALTAVNLRGNFLDGTLGRSLAAAVASHPSLTSLGVGGTRRYKMGDDGAAALATALRSNPRVTRLDLSLCNLADGPGMQALARALAANTSITDVNLSDNNLGLEAGGHLLAALQQRLQDPAKARRSHSLLQVTGNIKMPTSLQRKIQQLCRPLVTARHVPRAGREGFE